VKRLRSIGNVVTEHARVIDYVLLELIAFRFMLRIPPHSKQHLDLLITFEHRIRQETNVLGLLPLRPQPVRVLIAIVWQRFKVLGLIDVEKVIGGAAIPERFEKLFVVTPTVRLRTEKRKTSRCISQEGGNVRRKPFGRNPVDVSVTFFAPGFRPGRKGNG
jgi:hypothetical protein